MCIKTDNSHKGFFPLTLSLGVSQDLEHLRIDGVLSKRPHHVATLAVGDLPLTRPVKQKESLLELWHGRQRDRTHSAYKYILIQRWRHKETQTHSSVKSYSYNYVCWHPMHGIKSFCHYTYTSPVPNITLQQLDHKWAETKGCFPRWHVLRLVQLPVAPLGRWMSWRELNLTQMESD